MDDIRFDHWTRGLDVRLSRRGLSGVVAGALAVAGLAAETDAKKRKKRKKKKKKGNSTPGTNYSCGNLGAPCGNTLVCQCRLSKTSKQVCMNTVNPPNGISFPPCQSQSNCGAGQFCDLQFSQCALACPN